MLTQYMDMHSAMKLGNLSFKNRTQENYRQKKKNLNNLFNYKPLVNCGKINKSLVDETKETLKIFY